MNKVCVCVCVCALRLHSFIATYNCFFNIGRTCMMRSYTRIAQKYNFLKQKTKNKKMRKKKMHPFSQTFYYRNEMNYSNEKLKLLDICGYYRFSWSVLLKENDLSRV
jgi:hypothetical protein